jgi:hypothetical protein
VICIEAATARAQQFRYLEFSHPGVKNEFVARISIYPKEDLSIKRKPE